MTPKLLIEDISDYCDLPEGLDRIECVYIFDDDIRVNCCSLTPSLECEHLYNVLHFADDVGDATREVWYEEFDQIDNDVSYFSTGWSGIIDLEDDGSGYDDWEDVVEYYNCNHAY